MQDTLPAAADVEEALAAVYARAELTPDPPSRLSVWLADLWRWILDRLAAWLPEISVAGTDLRWLVFAVGALLAAAAIALLVYLLRRSAAWWQMRDRPGREVPDGEGIVMPADAAVWEERARALAGDGHWREAALALYQALLLWLEARGAVRYDAAKTPGDYRREVRRDAALARRFDAFLRTFEPAAFGARPLDGAGYDRLLALAGEVRPRG